MSDEKKKMREKTASQIQLAIQQLQKEGGPISISKVAKVAGFTPALIHNTYPDWAEKIRAITGKGVRAQRDEKHQALMEARTSLRELRKVNAALTADLAKQASINQTLLAEIAMLKGMATGKVTGILRDRSESY